MNCRYLLLSILTLIPEALAWASPQEPAVIHGTVDIAQPSSSSLHITASDRAIIHWKDFSIRKGETVRFIQPGKSACALNRVVSYLPSSLLGSLEANGVVYLINPNGLIIGKDALIDTAGFFASTLDILDDSFLANGDLVFKGDSREGIINYGTIEAWDGDIGLFAYFVENQGSLSAPKGLAAVAAGQEILLKPQGEERVFIRPSASKEEKLGMGLQNGGSIEAVRAELKAEGNAYSMAINHEGIIEASGIGEVEGRVYLYAPQGNISITGKISAQNGDETGGRVFISGGMIGLLDQGVIDVSGKGGNGEVKIGNREESVQVYIGPDAAILAEAKVQGCGGDVTIWGDHATLFYGTINASGIGVEGHGGTVEISSKNFLDFNGIADRSSPGGQAGILLLDPTDMQISTGGNANVTATSPFEPVAAGTTGNLLFSTLSAALLTGPVTVQTIASGAQLGDLTWVDDVSGITITSPFTLTLNAANNILMNSIFQNAGAGSVVMTSNQDIIFGPTSMSPCGIILGSGTIMLNAGRHIVVNGGAVSFDNTVIQQGSGAMTLNLGLVDTTGSLSILGGPGPQCNASVIDLGGPIAVNFPMTSTGSVSLMGGGSTNCQAEIYSNMSSVTFNNVGGGITLTGGSDTNCYAEIGQGDLGSFTSITSDLIFNAIVGDVILNGGSGPGAYAQIGHAPLGTGSAVTVSGDIQLATTRVMGALTLNGGMGVNASAIVGHGNELSPSIGDCSGAISILVNKAPALTGGTASGAHAIIGFANPSTGSVATFNCVSTGINVNVVIQNDVDLIAGAGNNAVIGYYNGTDPSNATSVNIAQINVTEVAANDISLQAGSSGGVAAIGTLSNLGSAQSAINLTARDVILNGPTAGNFGAARIINSQTSPPGTTPVDVTITTVSSGDLDVLGGVGLPTGFADIYSSGDLFITYDGSFNVNNTTQTGPASVVGYSSVQINTSDLAGDMNVIGGSNFSAAALVQSLNGPIILGADIPGAADLIVGDPASIAPSQMLIATGPSFLSVLMDMTITGGAGAGMDTLSSGAEIRADAGTLTLNLNRDLILQGGTDAFCFAQITNTSGDLLISFIGRNVSLTGGSGTDAYAQIGTGNVARYPTIPSQITSTINFGAIPGSVMLTGGSATDAYAQIGQAPYGLTTPIGVVGDVLISPIGNVAGPVVLQGGSALNTTAIIGDGNELSSTMTDCQCNIQLVTTDMGGITLNTGSALVQAHAIIGFHNPSVGVTSPGLNVVSDSVNIGTSVGPISLNAENMMNSSNAVIGYYNGATSGSASVTIQDLTITAQNNSITLQAGNDAGTQAGIAAIGTFNPIGIVQSNITITDVTLNLFGPTGTNDGAARVLNNINGLVIPPAVAAAFDISIFTNDINVLGGTGSTAGFSDIYSSEFLTIDFTNDFTINNLTQNGYARVVAASDILINQGETGQTLSLTGGTNFIAEALIQSLSGQALVSPIFGSNVVDALIGNAASFAPSRIIAEVNNNGVGTSQDVILQGGQAADTVALIQNTSGSIFVSASRNITLTGGTGGAQASAEFRNDSGSITIQNDQDILLTGGGSSLCYAQIASNTGNVIFNSIGRNLTLQGGTALQAYAQIGVGFFNNATLISSNINFSQIGGSVSLLPGAVDSTYAQIGQSPFGGTSLINIGSSSVSFPIGGISGNILLQGGSGPNTTAIIGHGNELSSFMSGSFGSIGVAANGSVGISILAGTGSKAHAVIGYQNPDAGSTNGFSVTAGTLSVSAGTGPILATAGTGTNAVIGYYNPTTGTNTAFRISTISVSSPVLKNINLQAGATGGVSAGAAVIGTLAQKGSTASSTINISTGTLNLFGPTGTNDGSARVVNSLDNPATTAPFDISIITGNALNPGTINVLGGTGAATGFADIYSSRNLTTNFTAGLNVNFDPLHPTILQKGNGTATAYNNISMNLLGAAKADITVIGGATAPIITEINSITGTINIGNGIKNRGARNITVGSSSMVGEAEFFTAGTKAPGGNFNAFLTGNIAVTGGLNSAATAEMCASISMAIDNLGSIAVASGSAANANATMCTSTGNSAINSGLSITLTGVLGTSTASIQNFGPGMGNLSATAGTDFTLNANAFIQNAGNGNSNVAAGSNLTLTGNSFIQNVGKGIMTVSAANNIGLSSTSFIRNQGIGSLTALAGVDILLFDVSSVISTGGTISLVVDNQFPIAPGIGPGVFNTAPDVQILTVGGPLRIFTATQPQNLILSLLNGVTYIEGTQFVNTPTEQWNTYYNNNFNGFPFTVFYKNGGGPTPPHPTPPFPPAVIVINNTNSVVISENIYDLHTYDEFIFYRLSAMMGYDRLSDKEFPHARGSLSSYGVLRDRYYLMLRQVYRNYNTKDLDYFRTP